MGLAKSLTHPSITLVIGWISQRESTQSPAMNLDTLFQLLTNHCGDPPETTGSCVEVERWPPQQSQRQLWAAVHILQMACALWDYSKVLENNEG